ncbi:unnamed protein product, partial [Ixodes hexagonus]
MCPMNPTQCIKECMVTRGVAGYCGGFLNSHCYCMDSQTPDQPDQRDDERGVTPVEDLVPVPIRFMPGNGAIDAAREELLADAYRHGTLEANAARSRDDAPL